MKRIVFISSTYSDLKEERRAVWNLLEEFKVDVRGMEEFGARPEAPLETCLAEVDLSDIYIGIIALRLGSIEVVSGRSYTQLEYERAYEHDKDILIYLIDEENAKVSLKNIDFGEKRELLRSFKRLLRDRHTVGTFRSSEGLVESLRRDFNRLLEAKEPPEPELQDEFERARAILGRFFLVPKDSSGREVLLSVEVTGAPYPASKEICGAFNLDFGSTVGIKVSVVRPEGYHGPGLDELYLDGKQLDSFLPADKGEVKDIYARLQFSDSPVSRVRARFRREIIHTPPSAFIRLNQDVRESIFGRTVELQPDGKAILLLSKFAEGRSSASSA